MSKKISELTALTTPATDDLLAVVDTSEVETKKITLSNLKASGTDIDTGTEDVKFVTPKAIEDSTKIAQTDEDTTFKEELIAGSIAGKNLFNIFGSTVRSANTTLTATGNTLRAIDTRTNASNVSDWAMIKLGGSELLSKTISAKCNYSTSTTNKAQFGLYYTDASGNNEQLIQVGTATTGSGTFALENISIASSFPGSTTQVSVIFYATSNTPITTGDYVEYSNIQVELGSTVTTYYPYFNFGLQDLSSQVTLNATYISGSDTKFLYLKNGIAYLNLILVPVAGTYTSTVLLASGLYRPIQGIQYQIPGLIYKSGGNVSIRLRIQDNGDLYLWYNASVTLTTGDRIIISTPYVTIDN